MRGPQVRSLTHATWRPPTPGRNVDAFFHPHHRRAAADAAGVLVHPRECRRSAERAG